MKIPTYKLSFPSLEGAHSISTSIGHPRDDWNSCKMNALDFFVVSLCSGRLNIKLAIGFVYQAGNNSKI
jgi:hypothetical protein